MVIKEINLIIDIDDDGIIQDYDIIGLDSIRLKDPEVQRICTDRKISKCPHCSKNLEIILHLSGISGSMEFIDESNYFPDETEDENKIKKEFEDQEFMGKNSEDEMALVQEILKNDLNNECVQVIIDPSDRKENSDRRHREDEALLNSEFCCSSCEHCFKNKAGLIAHLRNCKKGPIMIEGKWKQPKLSRQQKYQESLLRADFCCHMCERIFKSRAALIAHLKTCTGTDIRCDLCGQQCESRKKLSKHMTVAHNKMKHVCFICGNAFKAKWLLEEHVARHSDPKPYKCDLCNKAFSSKETIKIHLRVNHLPSFTGYTCSICEKVYPTNAKLQRHMQSRHHSTGSYVCEVCSYKFGTQKQLELHIYNIHTPEDEKNIYKCTMCKHTSTSQARIEQHQMIHTDRRQWPFGCDICGKRFVQKHSLERHSTIHTGKKPFSCEICGQTFRLSYQVKQHSLIHQPDLKPLQCPHCEKAYRDRASFNKHVKSHETVEEINVSNDTIVLEVSSPYHQIECEN